MSVLSQPASTAVQPPTYPVYRFSVDDYHQMIQTGILAEDAPVELLEGWLVPKMPHNPLHDGTIQVVEDTVRPKLPPGWRLRVQSAITTGDSEPEPDLAIVAGDARTYLNRHPQPSDMAILMEVADTSLNRDRQDKGRLFARAQIACYWIVNLLDRQVEVYTDPTGPDANPHYRQKRVYDANDAVPLLLDGQERGPIPVRLLLP
jgi:hypothetical protein